MCGHDGSHSSVPDQRQLELGDHSPSDEAEQSQEVTQLVADVHHGDPVLLHLGCESVEHASLTNINSEVVPCNDTDG